MALREEQKTFSQSFLVFRSRDWITSNYQKLTKKTNITFKISKPMNEFDLITMVFTNFHIR